MLKPSVLFPLWLFSWGLLSLFAVTPPVQAQDSLKIVYNSGVRPLKFEDNEQRAVGFFPDLWKLWSEKSGRPIEFVRADSFEQSLAMLKQGTVDLHAGLFKTREREAFLTYSVPILDLEYFIFTHMSIYPVRSFSETSGLMIGIAAGGYTEKYVRTLIPPERIVVYDSFTSLFTAALKGEIKVFVSTKLSLFYFLKERYIPNIFEFYEDHPLFSQTYYTAVEKENRHLISEVNDGFNAISGSERKRLEERWLFNEVKDLPPAPSPEDSVGGEAALQKRSATDDGTAASVSVEQRREFESWQIVLYGVIVFLVLTLVVWLLIRTIKGENIALTFGSKWFRIVILLGLSAFVIFACLLALVTLQQNKIKILSGVGDYLENTLRTAENRLEFWLEHRRSFVRQLGWNPELAVITRTLLDDRPQPDQAASSRPLKEARLFLKRNGEIFSLNNFFIIAPDHVIIASECDALLNSVFPLYIRKPALVKRAFAGETLFVPPGAAGETGCVSSRRALQAPDPSGGDPNEDKNRTCTLDMFFMAPIQDMGGAVMAVMAFRVDPEKDFSGIFKLLWMGDTEETFAFDLNGRLLSRSRYEDWFREKGISDGATFSPCPAALEKAGVHKGAGSFLNLEIRDPGGNMVTGFVPEKSRQQLPFTVMVRRAFKLKQTEEALIARGESHRGFTVETDIRGYRDYRGVPVFGAWLWNSSLGMGLATEMDVVEALSTYFMMKWTVFGMLGFALFFSVGATLFVLIVGERTNNALVKARDNLEEKVSQRTLELSRNQEQLKSAEARIRLILNSAGEGVFGVDMEGCCTFANPAALGMLKYDVRAILGRSIHEQIHHSHVDGTPYPGEICPITRAYQYGDTETVSNEVLWRSDDTSFPVEYTATPVIQEGTITGAVITFRDITDRIKMEERLKGERKELQQILDTSPIGVTIVIGDIIRFINPRMSRFTGLQQGDAIDRIRYVDADARRDLLEMIGRTGNVEDYEIQVYDADDKIRDFMGTFMMTQYDGENGFLGWVVDVTELKKTENRLREKFDELARFRRLAVGRELKMIQLKKEINRFCKEVGIPEKYDIVSHAEGM